MNNRSVLIIAIILLGAVIAAATVYTRRDTSYKNAVTVSNEKMEMSEDMTIAPAKAKPAPKLSGGDWINSESLTLDGLRGRVVYLEFWTFSCYNCLNTLPRVKALDAKYRDQGLTVIGVQSPEFEREKDLATITRSVKKLEIEYPVVTDNEMKTWNSYGVNAWPTIVIIDKQGRIRYRHVGEGAYDEQEKVVKLLLSEDRMSAATN